MRDVVAPVAVKNVSFFILCFCISLARNNEREGKLLLSSYSERSENGSATSKMGLVIVVVGPVYGVNVVPVPVQPPPVPVPHVVDAVIDPPVVVIPDGAEYTPR